MEEVIRKWYGWEFKEKTGSISTILAISGRGRISIMEIAGIQGMSQSIKSSFNFEAGDELKLFDEGDNLIIQISNCV